MKKAFLILTVVFGILTCAGIGYVLIRHGQADAGYACVPMVFTFVFLALFRASKN